MMRWLIRLAVGGLIVGLLAYAWSQLNSELDDDDLDDDIPLEFEVPLDSLPATTDGASDTFAAVDADTGEGPGANLAATALDETTAADSGDNRARVKRTNEANEDDLTLIRGIGPVFQKRLNDAGIKTFHQLAESNATHLEAQGIEGVGVDLASWIEQAQDLATRPEA